MSKITLYGGNAATVMRQHVADESVQLIYADPPFTDARNYNFPVEGSYAHQQQYARAWTWGEWHQMAFNRFQVEFRIMPSRSPERRLLACLEGFHVSLGQSSRMANLLWLAPVLLETHRKLRSTGLLWLHCNYVMAAHYKCLLDAIYGDQHYLAEVIWTRNASHNDANKPGSAHDTLLLFAKSFKHSWYPVLGDRKTKAKYWKDQRGVYTLTDVFAEGLTEGQSGQPWRGRAPRDGCHWTVPYGAAFSYQKFTGQPLEGSVLERFDKLEAEKLLHYGEKGGLQAKVYLVRDPGAPINDVWDDIHPVAGSGENWDFDGQKPRALLDRIIAASTDDGDMILDPFIGSGTTAIAAANRLRPCIGIDLNQRVLNLAKRRIYRCVGDAATVTATIKEPQDLESYRALAEDPDDGRYRCQVFVADILGGKVGPKGPDGGRDVLFNFSMGTSIGSGMVSVKSSSKPPTKDHVRSVRDQRNEEKFDVAVIVASDFTDGQKKLALDAGFFPVEGRLYQKVQLIREIDLLEKGLGAVSLPGATPANEESPRAGRGLHGNVEAAENSQ